jgi:acetyltransferase-like isoleucine patch superfamily enzyme
LKNLVKSAVRLLSLILVSPLAAVALFGRFRAGFSLGAQICAGLPGLPGDYLRTAFYHCTLRQAPLDFRISYGSFFAHPDAVVGRSVYIGAYSVLGRVSVGDRAQIASQVMILSGARQHRRDSSGRLKGSEDGGEFTKIVIEEDCWIGSSAVIMADVGARATVGAGSVVTRPVPSGCVVAGNPARVIRENESST